MAVIALIFAILLANRVKPAQITLTASAATDVNTLQEDFSKAVFALQIRQIRTTSEAPPAASSGNNLNDVATSQPHHGAENFQPISTIYSFQNKKTQKEDSNRKYDVEGNVELLLPFEKNGTGNEGSLNSENMPPQPLIWDSCLETSYKDSRRNLVKLQNDMEISRNDMPMQVETNKENLSAWSKRNADGISSMSVKAWIEKYNSLKSANMRMGERRQAKPESVLTRKISPSPEIPSTTVQVVPITRDIFREATEHIPVEVVTDNISSDYTGYTEDWFEAKDRTKIRFSGLPQKETYLIPALNLEESFHPFGFMSEFFSLIYPFESPIVLETSEAPPAASSGNNLNDVATSQPHHGAENFQPISTIYSFQNKKTQKEDSNRKYDVEGNVELLLPFEKNGTGNEGSLNSENMPPQPLIWDSCLETSYKDSRRNLVKLQNDMEISRNDMPMQVETNKENLSAWSKRNADGISSMSVKAWIEKYNSLKSANMRMGERRQAKPESVLTRKISPSPEIPSTTVQVVPITRDIFREATEHIPVEVVTDNISSDYTGYTEDWFEAKDRTKIRFSGLPQKETYLIPALNLEESFHPFGFMSEFFSLIYPFESPIGLIKDIIWGKFNFPYSFLQSIKVESTFLGIIIVFICIALVIPSYLIILAILYLCSGSACDDDTETGALFPEAEESSCNDRVVVVVTLFFVTICCILIAGMAVSNEQAYGAASSSRNVVSCACADIAAWLAAAARELHHSVVPPVDMVLKAYKDDLRNVETLLGEPIQQAIASESGIDLVFDSMNDIVTETEDLSSKISSLRDLSIRAGTLATATSGRIKDLSRQIDNVKKHCTFKDSPLCDTVNTNSLELLMKFDSILHEQQLMELRSLGVENLTRAVSTAKQEFRTLPSAISTQTSQVKEDILRDMESKRQQVHNSVRILTDIVRHLNAGLHTVARKADSGLERVQTYEFWRWTLTLACIVSFAFVTLLILLGMVCGCGAVKGHAKRTLQVSAGWLCFVSLVLWGLVSTSFLVAGHAEIYVCNALWDTQYTTLSNLLDRPSPLLPDNEGIFDAMFRDMENVTIDVSVKDVLRDCEKDQPAYTVFQLEKVIDVNKETSYFEWVELQRDLGKLAKLIDVGFLKTVSAYFNKLLNQMLVVSDVNLAKYRMDYNGPILGKDLPSLVDQLENVAAQVSDLTTAGRLETLATRLQRIHVTNIKPLEQLRADLVFKLTELELQMSPFRKKLNISLSHIHTAQFYIDNQGDVIAHKKISVYVSRLVSHAAGWRTHVLDSTGKRAAKCRPLFAVFSALRSLLCINYVSSLHGWWVLGLLLGVIWCTAVTPLLVKLWRIYGRKVRAREALALTNLGSAQQETPTTALCVSNWNTPGPPPPPRSDSW